jgi:hypothetical protein
MKNAAGDKCDVYPPSPPVEDFFWIVSRSSSTVKNRTIDIEPVIYCALTLRCAWYCVAFPFWE